MAATNARTMGEKLRHAADRLCLLADLADTPQRNATAVQRLHDEIETVAGDVRATVRGRGFA